MPDVALNYAPPVRRRRHRAVIALILSAVATGVVGKLCWDKFSGPVKRHLSLIHVQRDLAKSPGQSISIADASKPPTITDKQFVFNTMNAHVGLGDSPQFVDWYHGPIGPDDRKRVLCLEISPTPLSPQSAITLVARVYSQASLFSAARQHAGPQYLMLGTYRSTVTFDAPTRSATDPSLLVLTGKRDDVPFRYELSLDGKETLQLVEDTSIVSPPVP